MSRELRANTNCCRDPGDREMLEGWVLERRWGLVFHH